MVLAELRKALCWVCWFIMKNTEELHRKRWIKGGTRELRPSSHALFVNTTVVHMSSTLEDHQILVFVLTGPFLKSISSSPSAPSYAEEGRQDSNFQICNSMIS